MNWIDTVIVVILVVLGFLGLKRGLIGALVPLVGITLGVLLAGQFYADLADRLSFISSVSLARIIAFVVVLAVVFIAVRLLGSLVQKMVHLLLLGWVDRLAGVAFGLAIGWIVTSVIVAVLARYVTLPVELPDMAEAALGDWVRNWRGLMAFRDSVNTAISESTLAGWQLDSFPVILSLLPGEFDAVRNFFGR